jgi:hypothetical protein
MRNIIVGFICLFSLTAFGQRVSLQSQISVFEKQFNTTFSYDKILVEGIDIDSLNFVSIQDSINFLNLNSAFVFEKIDSSNVLVSPVVSGKNLLIKGRLRIAENEPAIGGTIVIENQNLSSAVDIEGNYLLRGVLNNLDSVVFQMIGYDDLTLPVEIWNEGSLDTLLLERSVSIDDVIINSYLTNGFQYNHKDQSIDLKVENLGLLPGETEVDILTSIQALPGINSPTGKSGDLVTRGSDPDKTLISYDNIPIYHKGHYFGTFSPFNTELIKDIKIQRNGGQGSSRGGRVGGIIEISTRNKVVDSLSASAGVGTSYYSASANIPIVKKKLSAIVGFRKSYPASFNSIKIDSLNSFVFQQTKLGAALFGTPAIKLLDYSFDFYDANAKLIYQINNRHKLELTGISIYNQLEVSLAEMFEITKDTIQLSNWGVNLQLSSKWSDSFSSITSITNSVYLEDIGGKTNFNAELSIDEFKNGSNDLTLKNLNEFNFKEHQKLSFGVESNYYDVTNEQHAFSSTEGKQEVIKSAADFLHSAFLDFKNYRAYKVFTFSVGARSSYFTGTNKLYFEPRVMANYHINDHFAFKFNAGKYHQYINHIYGTKINNLQGINTINWQLSNDKDKPVVESSQTSIGFIWDKAGWVVDVEGYAKKTENISAGNYFTGDSIARLVHGGYNTIGADFLIKKKLKNFETWLGYSYMNSEAKFGETSFKYVWNQTHLFNFVLGYNFRNLKISTGWKYVSGFLSDDIRVKFLEGASNFLIRNPIANDQLQEVYVLGSVQEYEESFPDNHQMDLSVSYFIKSKNDKWKLILGGAITNLYDNRLILSQVTRPAQGPPGSLVRYNKTGFGRLFNATLKVVWR